MAASGYGEKTRVFDGFSFTLLCIENPDYRLPGRQILCYALLHAYHPFFAVVFRGPPFRFTGVGCGEGYTVGYLVSASVRRNARLHARPAGQTQTDARRARGALSPLAGARG